jgi:predicted DNA-binding transcriptional regulator YafY
MASHPDTLNRQWLMLQCIPRQPRKVTARALAAHLQEEGFAVTKRTVERDLVALSAAFPLVADERSKPFGWSWQKDAPQFSLPGMSPLQALVLNLAHGHLKHLLPSHLLQPLEPYFQQSDATLRQSLGKSGLRAWTRRVAVVPPTQPLLPPKVNDKAIAVIHAALAENRQVELRYRNLSRTQPAKYRVHPLGLVYRGVVGYLVATVADFEDPRMLALHRVDAARSLDAPACAPPGFDLQEYAQSSVFGFMDNGPIKLVVRMESPAAAHLYDTPLSQDQVIANDEREGWLRITATVSDTSQLRWWLLGFGSQVEVVEPLTLREWVACEAGLTSAWYGLNKMEERRNGQA